MEIKAKLYPYPILAYFAQDFKSSSDFTVSAVPKVDGFKQEIILTALLKNVDLQTLIAHNKAEMIFHLECAQTGYREILHATGDITTLPIVDAKISGKLQICPFILAKEDMPNYTNSDLEDDLIGIPFSVEKGNILAVAKQINVKVKKKADDLRNLPSIINVTLNGDTDEKYMIVDYDGKLINVLLPDEEWNRVDTLSKNNALTPIFNCLIAVPALSFVLAQLQKMSPGERQAIDDDNRVWYDSIKRSLINNFGIDIEGTDFENANALKLAQQLVNGPLNDALKNLAGGDSQ